MEDVISRLKNNADNIMDDAVNFLGQMVEIPTENPPGSNYEEFAKLFSEKLNSEGYSSKIIEVPENRLPELCQFGTGPRPSVIGLKGNGKLKITLNGHYDVVPAGTGWKTDPFKPLISNSYLYGRGSSDMKGGLAMQIYAIKLLENTVGQIFDKISIMQTAVPDEETVGNKNAGMYYLMESKIISRENTDFVIFTEPLGVDNICYGHRGAIFITVKVFGRKSHGSMAYLGKDAISGAVDLITLLNKYSRDLEMSRISKYNIIPEGSKKPGMAIGYLRCGTWANTIADECEFSVYRRLIPEENLNDERDKLYELIKSFGRSSRYDIEIKEYYITDSILEDKDGKYYKLFIKGFEMANGKKPSLVLSPGTFDMRFTNHYGIPSLNYGPGILEESHMNDEKISLEDLRQGIITLASGIYSMAYNY